MKKIGLVGGISWTSTIDNYRFVNQETNSVLGGLNFAECIIYSVNFDHFRKYNAAHDWDATFALLLDAGLQLQNAGAEVLLLGANTAHIVAERIQERLSTKLIDIRIATSQAIQEKKLKKVGLLGTVYTMELDFYKRTIEEHGIEVITPEQASDRKYIEETLLHELGNGIIVSATKSAYLQIANALIKQEPKASSWAALKFHSS